MAEMWHSMPQKDLKSSWHTNPECITALSFPAAPFLSEFQMTYQASLTLTFKICLRVSYETPCVEKLTVGL